MQLSAHMPHLANAVATPHGEGLLFYSLGDVDFIESAEGFSFVPSKLMPGFQLGAYQASRYGELSARCWPVIRVAHALPDFQKPATIDSPGAIAFLGRLNKILDATPKI